MHGRVPVVRDLRGVALGPVGHIAVSVGVGAAVWAGTGSPLAVPVAAATGVLTDVDHVIDYFNLFVRRDDRRVFVVFHAWEYSLLSILIVLGVWYHPLLLAAALGHLGHVTAGHLANRPAHPLAYSIAYRTAAGFDWRRLFGEPPASFLDSMGGKIPMWRYIEPGLDRLASRVGSDRR